MDGHPKVLRRLRLTSPNPPPPHPPLPPHKTQKLNRLLKVVLSVAADLKHATVVDPNSGKVVKYIT
jgi:hypothetical protein